ncbi:BZ3500_MvSof-1268-A1-R1_Chr3-1g06110 [Microbotryum saponariae]|uniref:BZ3500_MvSof-1268-A1-R1_Chr3-1g06110 protein n=1 Tax=Microbotryum saponariae TaxID=289078 RepID=A0A2X0KZB9_9BASI|nr:BZ3500_MvSof-1268-A1-R1_Chr3-1g06110 [Microbotryum saponariae]SDA03973.1 BZ3501_MvSof-1269-A2-R1_Chr3-2g05795 [Microbotryum saponariae]
MAKLTLQARREMPQTLTLRPPAATSPALSAKDPGAQSTSSSPSLAVPTSAGSSSGGIHRSIKDTWSSRNRSSTSTNITPPILSPAYSESGASTYEVPLTPFSAVPTNFSRHHPQFQFLDSPDEVDGDHSDDLSGTYRGLPISASSTFVIDGASTDSLPRPCSFGDLVMSGHRSTSWFDSSPTGDTTSATLSKPFLLLGETDDTDVLAAPHLPYSTDLSRQRVPSSNDSLGDTETSSEFSPSTSLVSVRIARLIQRETFATPGLDLSSDQLEGGGATQATSTGLVGNPTSPLTPVLMETEWISGSIPRVAGDEPSPRPSASPRTMAMRRKDVSALEPSRPLSEVFLSDLSEADATVRMRTILGPKTRIISPAPWDDPDGVAPGVQDEPAPSTKFRKSANTRRTEPNKPTSPNGPPSPAKENLGFKARLGNRSKSFSLLTGKKSPAHEDTFESDAALNALMPTSSPKAFGTKATPRINTGNAINGTGLSSPLSPALSVSSYGSNRTPIPSSPDSAALSSIDSERSSILTLAVPVASACVPQSAHADVSSFAPTSSSSDLRDEQSAGCVSTSALDERDPYYVAADPDGYTSLSPRCPMGNDAPMLPTGPGKNYKLISLDEARKREEDRKAAVAQRGQAAASSSSGPRPDEPAAKQDAYDYSAERLSASINGITISSPRTNVPPPATPGTAAKTLKNRRSGFLKRMMGVSEKTEPIPRIPSLPQASPTSASFPQQVESSPSVHSNLNESPSVIGPASPTSMLQSSFLPRASSGAPPSRVAFSSMPVPDPEHRLRNVRGADGAASAPSLSLRPVSMAFSAGLPSELMAEIEAAEMKEAKLSALSADTVMRNTAALRSPHAPSFVSDTTYASSFETAPTSPDVHTPLTSVFPVPPSQAPTSLKIVSPSRGRPWEVERAELEETIRLLRAQLYDQECECPECGHEFKPVLTTPSTPMSPSVVDRPRFPGHAAFGSARVLF